MMPRKAPASATQRVDVDKVLHEMKALRNKLSTASPNPKFSTSSTPNTRNSKSSSLNASAARDASDSIFSARLASSASSVFLTDPLPGDHLKESDLRESEIVTKKIQRGLKDSQIELEIQLEERELEQLRKIEIEKGYKEVVESLRTLVQEKEEEIQSLRDELQERELAELRDKTQMKRQVHELAAERDSATTESRTHRELYMKQNREFEEVKDTLQSTQQELGQHHDQLQKLESSLSSETKWKLTQENELIKTKEELQILTHWKEQSEKLIEEQRAIIDSLRRASEDSSQHNELLKKENQRLSSLLEKNSNEAISREEHSKQLEEEILALNKERNDLLEAIANADEQLQSTTQQVESLQQEIQSLQQLEGQVTSSNSAIRQKDETIASLRTQLQNKDQALANLERELEYKSDEISHKMEHERRNHLEALFSASEDNTRLEQTVQRYNSEMKKREAELEALRGQIEAKDIRLKEQTAFLDELQAENAELQDNLLEVINDLKSKSNEFISVQEENITLHHEVDNMQAEIDDLHQRVDQLAESEQALKYQSQQMADQLDQLHQQKDELEEKFSSKEQDFDSVHREWEQLEPLRRTNKEYETELLEAKKKVEHLTTTINAMKSDLKTAEEQLDSRHQHINKLEQELQIEKEEMHLLEGEVSRLQELTSKQKHELMSKERALQLIESELTMSSKRRDHQYDRELEHETLKNNILHQSVSALTSKLHQQLEELLRLKSNGNSSSATSTHSVYVAPSSSNPHYGDLSNFKSTTNSSWKAYPSSPSPQPRSTPANLTKQAGAASFTSPPRTSVQREVFHSNGSNVQVRPFKLPLVEEHTQSKQENNKQEEKHEELVQEDIRMHEQRIHFQNMVMGNDFPDLINEQDFKFLIQEMEKRDKEISELKGKLVGQTLNK